MESALSEHRFEVSGGLSLVVTRELTAVVVDGWVEKEEVGAGTYIFAFAEDDDFVEIRARLRHPNSKNEFHRAFNELYNLMAGLLEAGCRVRVEGAWAEKMPQGHWTRPLALRPIFQHNLPPQERLPDLAPERVEEAVRDLPGRQNYTNLGERGFRHANGIVMTVLTSKAHRIAERSPLSCRLMTDYFDRGPLPASGWGEVWIGYWGHLGRGLPAALHIFPEEIGLVSDVQVNRYRVVDRDTLKDLSVLDFGSGPPLLYDRDQWLSFAKQCGDRGDYAMALRCCHQAGLCAGAGDEVAKEIAHWKEWQAYVPSEPVESGPLTFRGMEDLIDLIGFGERLRSIAEDIAWEIHDAESYRRQTQLLANILSYPVVTGHELLAAGVTPKVMEWLGLGSGPIAPPARYDTLFQLRLGEWIVWGTVCSGYMLVREEPQVLYKVAL